MAAVIGVCVMIGAATAVSEWEPEVQNGSAETEAVDGRGDDPSATRFRAIRRGDGAIAERGTSPARVEPRPQPRPSRIAARCPDHHRGLRYYRQRHAYWTSRLVSRGSAVRMGRAPRSCPDARYLAIVWRKRAARARQAYHRWVRNRYRAWLETPEGAIRHVFGPYAEQALRVSSCETGGTFDTKAENGQYLGLFQMGSSERARYGHGRSALEQARAAYRYFVASGRDWSPWSCKP